MSTKCYEQLLSFFCATFSTKKSRSHRRGIHQYAREKLDSDVLKKWSTTRNVDPKNPRLSQYHGYRSARGERAYLTYPVSNRHNLYPYRWGFRHVADRVDGMRSARHLSGWWMTPRDYHRWQNRIPLAKRYQSRRYRYSSPKTHCRIRTFIPWWLHSSCAWILTRDIHRENEKISCTLIMKTFTLSGISMVISKYQDFLELLKSPTENILVFTPNPEIFVRAAKDPEFKEMLQKATYNVPDWVGLYLGYDLASGKGRRESWRRFLFKRSKLIREYGELIKGSDLTIDIIHHCQQTGIPILIIDKKIILPNNPLEAKKQELQKKLKWELETLYPWLTVHVIFDGDMAVDGIAHFIEINNIGYVFSCLGMKVQEKALIDIWNYLPSYTKVVGLGVGASIDFLLGIQKRAPAVLQKAGLEWLYRLSQSPRTRIKRISDAVVEFPKLAKKK